MRKSFLLLACLALVLALTPGVATAVTAGQPLTFHELTPCALFDTRPSQGGTGIMAAGESRTFHVVGSTSDFAAQGGVKGGCGIPGFSGRQPQVQMVYLNLVAIDPVQGGNLKVWATTDPEPQGGVVNYQKLNPNFNNSNAIVVGVRQDAEGNDITVKANVGSVHVRGVALGYLTTGSNSFWALGGNSGTDPSSQFVGTTDNKALNFKVNDARALRLEPAEVPNVVGGASVNAIAGVNVIGATIGGGGCPASLCDPGGPNQATSSFGTVGGGYKNTADFSATVGGGFDNSATNAYGAVGGGSGNTASGERATVGGGLNNTASGSSAAVGGGEANTASGTAATVPGGAGNSASGLASFAAGLQAGANHNGAFVWADATGGNFASTAANEFAVRAGGGVRLVVGANTCQLSPSGAWTGSCASSTAQQAWLLAGNSGTNSNTDFLGTTDNTALNLRVNNERALRLEPHATSPNVIGGFSGNSVTAGVLGAVIGGGGASGQLNRVTDDYGAVHGGRANRAGNDGGTTSDRSFATVGGGLSNTASGSQSTVGGGVSNTASGSSSTVGGGLNNSASANGAGVAGGSFNLAGGSLSAVGGGQSNTASGSNATIGGGQGNVASGLNAAVPGGESNTAQGIGSLAAGRRAKANHDGSFVWGDNQNAEVTSDRANQFKIRAGGGMSVIAQAGGATPAALWVESTTDGRVLYATNSGTAPTAFIHNGGTGPLINAVGATGQPVFRVDNDGTVWAKAFAVWSDRARKAAFEGVDPARILAGVSDLPIRTWAYAGDDPTVRHLGPTAQDFHAAFGLGDDDTTITTVDADGVALAAIQGLNEKLDAEIGARREVAPGLSGSRGLPTTAWLGLAAAIGMLGLGLGRRWERRTAAGF
jgi:hypothetical protein